MLRNTLTSYGSVAKFLHWLMALVIIGLLCVGLYMSDLENSPDKFKLYGLHKSFGITALALVALRLLWKARNIQPPLPETMRRIEKFLAHAGHFALYACIIVMPLSGWSMSSAAGIPVSVFGLFTLPDLVSPDKHLAHRFGMLHEYTGYLLILLIALHVLAALTHHFYYKDNVLTRMLPFGKEK
jgi:cytochrome b561